MKFKVTYSYTTQKSFLVEATDENAAFEKVWAMPETQNDAPEADDIKIRKTR